MSAMGWRQRKANKEDWGDKPMQQAFVFDSMVSIRCGRFLLDGRDMRMQALAVERWLGLSGES